MIRLKDITKNYDNNVRALDYLNLRINQGEFVYLVGPSGAGKSTLIKLLYKQINPDLGDIKINGFDLAKIKPKEIPELRRTMGVVYQDFKLLPRLTVFENVAYALRVTETPEKKIAKRVNHVLDLVGLKNRGEVFPNQLSGGEQQRIAIARAIVNEPKVLIADEPTGNLDPNTTDEIMDIIEKINKGGTTILMATHNSDIVNNRTHRVVELKQGRKVRDDEKGGYVNED